MVIKGFLLSLGTALFTSMKETTTKFGTTKKVDNHILACAYVLFALPFLYVLLFWIDLPVLDVIFLKLLGFKAVLQIMALILIVSSFSKGDVSLVSPMMAFTPLFMLFFTGRIMSDESITLSGQIGVILIVAGFYKMEIDKAKTGLWKPLLILGKNKATLYMLIAAFIYSITSYIDQMGIEKLNALMGTSGDPRGGWLWTISTNSITAAGLLLVVIYRRIKNKQNSKRNILKIKNIKILLAVGALNGLAELSQATAIAINFPVIYVISIKRAGIVISVIWGSVLFKEKIKNRLPGAIVMVCGSVLIYSALIGK